MDGPAVPRRYGEAEAQVGALFLRTEVDRKALRNGRAKAWQHDQSTNLLRKPAAGYAPSHYCPALMLLFPIPRITGSQSIEIEKEYVTFLIF